MSHVRIGDHYYDYHSTSEFKMNLTGVSGGAPRSLKAILVEDNATQQNSIKHHLERKGLNVLTAFSSREAITLLQAGAKGSNIEDRIAIAVIDLKLGNDNTAGFAVLQEAVKDDFLQAIVLSKSSEHSVIIRAFELGATHYVVKGSKGIPKQSLKSLDDALNGAVARWSALCEIHKLLHEVRDSAGSQSGASAPDSLTKVMRVLEMIRILRGRPLRMA